MNVYTANVVEMVPAAVGEPRTSAHEGIIQYSKYKK